MSKFVNKKIRIRIENKNNHSFKVQKKERNSIVSFCLIVFVVISFLVSFSVQIVIISKVDQQQQTKKKQKTVCQQQDKTKTTPIFKLNK